MSKIFDENFPRLLHQYPFYAMLYLKCRRIRKDDLGAAMGVSFTNGQINLYYSMPIIEKLEMGHQEIIDVIHHELLHVVNGHVFMKDRKGHNWNVAMDLEINNKIPLTAEKIGQTVPKVNRQYNLSMEENQIHTYYYHYLKNSDIPKTPMDSHDMFEESDDSSASKQELSDLIRSTFERFKKHGIVTAGLIEELKAHLSPQVDWRRQFRNIVANNLNTVRKKTRSKVNRRLGWQLQGSKKDDFFNIAFCVDTSGSMSNEALSQCWAELVSLNRNNKVKITVIEADAEVKNVWEFNPKRMPEFQGRGGTCYTAPMLQADSINPDLILFYGDFDCADIPPKPKAPVIWIGVGNQPAPANFGKVIRVNV
jgi:predicted metal-dependent peptidase